MVETRARRRKSLGTKEAVVDKPHEDQNSSCALAKSSLNNDKTKETLEEVDTKWTAVYPLPSLSNFAKKLFLRRRSRTSQSLSPASPSSSAKKDDIYCTSESIVAAGCWLCSAAELPPWHFRHRHVDTGYRQCRTFTEGVSSLFAWHNETMNIWTHFLGALILLFKVYVTTLAMQNIVDSITAVSMIDTERTKMELGLLIPFLTVCMFLGDVVPIASSAFCHTFYGLSPRWHRFCWFTDFVGLMTGVMGITTGYLALVFLPCAATQHWFFIFASLVLAAYSILLITCWQIYRPRMRHAILTPNDRFPEFAKHMGIFSLLCFLISTVITVFLCPDYFIDPHLSRVLYHACLFPACITLSLLIFAQGHVPERFGKYLGLSSNFFDIVGHSHQCWHIASAALLYGWMEVVQDHFLARWERGCPVV